MPPRAILCATLVLIGTLSGAAATLSPTTRNNIFQPRSTLNPVVIKPAQAKTLGTKQRINGGNIQKFTPIWRTPAPVKSGQTAANQPDGVVVRSDAVKAAGGSGAL